jgi:acyl carrier protein
MDRATLRTELLKLLENNIGKTFPDLDDSDDLRTELGLDSVDLVTLVIEVQTAFNIEIASEELAPLTRVGELLDLIQAKVSTTPRTFAA